MVNLNKACLSALASLIFISACDKQIPLTTTDSNSQINKLQSNNQTVKPLNLSQDLQAQNNEKLIADNQKANLNADLLNLATKENIANLKPIVLKSLDSVNIPMPQDSNSASIKTELTDLHGYQEKLELVKKGDTNSIVKWNEIARNLVIKYNTNPPMASRVYSLLSVAQYDSLASTYYNKYRFKRKAPSAIDSGLNPAISVKGDIPSFPSEHAAIAEVSADILSYLYPNEKQYLAYVAKENKEARIWAGTNFWSDINAGETIGYNVAEKVIERAVTDASGKAAQQVDIMKGDGYWTSKEGVDPFLPNWGNVKPWLVDSIQILPFDPPPAFGSDVFN